MKVKITDKVPVEQHLRPTIGEVYDVLRIKEGNPNGTVYFINVDGSAVGVFGRECLIVDKAPITTREHVLLTHETCGCDKNSERECPVCDWGLGVCAVCGAAECELMDMPDCPGHKGWRTID